MNPNCTCLWIVLCKFSFCFGVDLEYHRNSQSPNFDTPYSDSETQSKSMFLAAAVTVTVCLLYPHSISGGYIAITLSVRPFTLS